MRHAKIRRAKTLAVACDKRTREAMERKIERVRNFPPATRKRVATHLLQKLLARSEDWAEKLADEVERLVAGRA